MLVAGNCQALEMRGLHLERLDDTEDCRGMQLDKSAGTVISACIRYTMWLMILNPDYSRPASNREFSPMILRYQACHVLT